jgi:hypothetical protein
MVKFEMDAPDVAPALIVTVIESFLHDLDGNPTQVTEIVGVVALPAVSRTPPVVDITPVSAVMVAVAAPVPLTKRPTPGASVFGLMLTWTDCWAMTVGEQKKATGAIATVAAALRHQSQPCRCRLLAAVIERPFPLHVAGIVIAAPLPPVRS